MNNNQALTLQLAIAFTITVGIVVPIQPTQVENIVFKRAEKL